MRLVIAAVFAMLLAAASAAAANTLNVPQSDAAGGENGIEVCGSGFGIDYAVRDAGAGVFKVEAVIVGDIPGSCVGGNVTVALLDAGQSFLVEVGPQTITGDEETLAIPLADQPEDTDVNESRLVVDGP